MDTKFDRSLEDLGNVVALEHVNVAVPDHDVAEIFYLGGLGLAREPGIRNFWASVGRNQFHLPKGDPQVLRGHVGLTIPGRDVLLGRLASVKNDLKDTKFNVVEYDDFVEVFSPWGNRIRCFEPNLEVSPIMLGMPYVEFDVPIGAADGIARFYREIFETPAEVLEDESGRFARCLVGNHQHLIFRETDKPLPEYDEHHVQIYVTNFSGPHAKLDQRGLIIEESNQCQYRFQDIVDVESGEPLFTIEHEVRSLTHGLYGRPTVNRDAREIAAAAPPQRTAN